MNAPLPLHALGAQAAATSSGTPAAGRPADPDPQETAEWRDAFLALLGAEGPERARFVLDELAGLARRQRTGWQPTLNTPYVNTVAAEAQPAFPGDLAIEERLASLMRWNALAMV
ncbi:pyruvate dehydrogenase (acetyl-transferring), homodimeric type, partial [Rhizobium leguminosarum]|nr:pyruvate dehydrogenase (acetyl-transferring), homodimeric type [Rhizobium ruizarguesonis]